MSIFQKGNSVCRGTQFYRDLILLTFFSPRARCLKGTPEKTKKARPIKRHRKTTKYIRRLCMSE